MQRKWRFNKKEEEQRGGKEEERDLPHSTFKIQNILAKRSFFLNVMNIHIFLNLALLNHDFLDRHILHFAVATPMRDRLNRTSSDRTNPQPRGFSGISGNSPATFITTPLRQFLLLRLIRESNILRLVKATASELEIGTRGGRRRRRRWRIGSLLKAL